MKYIKSFFIISIIALTGCAKKHNISDVRDYVYDNLGLKEFEVNDKVDEVNDENGYIDYYWHINYKDISFDVIDDFYKGKIFKNNTLTDNFEDKVMEYYYNNFGYIYGVSMEKRYGNSYYSFICKVDNNNEYELSNCYNSVSSFLSIIDFNSYPIMMLNVDIVNQMDTHVDFKTIYKNKQIVSFEEFKN